MFKRIHFDTFVVGAIVAIVLAVNALPLAAASCESLASLKLPDTTVAATESVAAGAFAPPARGGREEIELTLALSANAFKQ